MAVNNNNGPLTDQVFGSLKSSMDKNAAEVAKFASKEELSEQDLIKFQMASSRYSTVVQMCTNLVKTLTENEKTIAQRM
jgi:hypothetical protein